MLASEGLGLALEERLKDGLERIAAEGGVQAVPRESFCPFCPYPGVCRVSEKGALAEEESDE